MSGSDPIPGQDNRPFFHVALNLSHAGRIARRIVPQLPEKSENSGAAAYAARVLAVELVELLDPYLDTGDNPPCDVSSKVRDRAASIARRLVEHVELGKLGHDRLGQCVRNLFECLELGREGADISLRAGENPKSLQRPM